MKEVSQNFEWDPQMFVRLTKCMDEFMKNIETAPEGSIEIYPLVRRLTLDNICRAAFSFATDVQKDAFGPKPKLQIAAERSVDLLGGHWLGPLARKYLWL